MLTTYLSHKSHVGIYAYMHICTYICIYIAADSCIWERVCYMYAQTHKIAVWHQRLTKICPFLQPSMHTVLITMVMLSLLQVCNIYANQNLILVKCCINFEYPHSENWCTASFPLWLPEGNKYILHFTLGNLEFNILLYQQKCGMK